LRHRAVAGRADADAAPSDPWRRWSGAGAVAAVGHASAKLTWEQTVLVCGDDQPVGNPKRKV
jgi:hypothetical protein